MGHFSSHFLGVGPLSYFLKALFLVVYFLTFTPLTPFLGFSKKEVSLNRRQGGTPLSSEVRERALFLTSSFLGMSERGEKFS